MQVNTRSPIPARPAKVASWAPRASPSRAISAKPRVIRAARALCLKPSPSLTPAARAITFFNAPPTSIPTTSWLVYTRKYSVLNSSCTLDATAKSSAATATAVGCSAATSLAKDGPERKALRCLTSVPRTSCKTSDIVNRVPFSIPLAAETNRQSSGMYALRPLRTWRMTCDGDTSSMSWLSLAASARSLV